MGGAFDATPIKLPSWCVIVVSSPFRIPTAIIDVPREVRSSGGAIEEEIRIVWGVLERWLVQKMLRLQWCRKSEVCNMGWVPCFKMKLLSFYTELEAHQHTVRKLKSTALS